MHGAEIFLILLEAGVLLDSLHTLHKLQIEDTGILQVLNTTQSYLEEENIGLLLIPHVSLHHGSLVQLLAGTRCW